MTAHIVAGGRLKDKLEQSAEMAGCALEHVAEKTTAWSSATFIGGNHELTIKVDGLSNRAWLEDLDEYSIYVPGFVLAKLEVSTIEVVEGQLVATIEALTVKEA
jgi:hypothetical protein